MEELQGTYTSNKILLILSFDRSYPANIYLFKVSYGHTKKRCEICSELTIKTRNRRSSGVFLINFEQMNASWVVHSVAIFNDSHYLY